MKKIFLSIALTGMSLSAVMAQAGKQAPKASDSRHTEVKATPTASPSTTMKADDMAFSTLTHDFGSIPEGPAATCEFTFKNNGSEPIILQKVQPSCGCTTPSYSKEPIAPGTTGTINISYNTHGKATPFTKTITVVSNAGTKVLTIKGNVEKAPTGSVPENTSMIRTN